MKARLAAVRAALGDWVIQTCLALDQLLNPLLLGFLAVVMAAVTGKPQATNFADETLSAHAFRAHRRGRIWARLLMPVIDLLFAWQKPDPAFRDDAGQVVTAHCHRAYLKERRGHGLPPEYRE